MRAHRVARREGLPVYGGKKREGLQFPFSAEGREESTKEQLSTGFISTLLQKPPAQDNSARSLISETEISGGAAGVERELIRSSFFFELIRSSWQQGAL